MEGRDASSVEVRVAVGDKVNMTEYKCKQYQHLNYPRNFMWAESPQAHIPFPIRPPLPSSSPSPPSPPFSLSSPVTKAKRRILGDSGLNLWAGIAKGLKV